MRSIVRLALLTCLFTSSQAAHAAPALRWGADAEAGAPYAFRDPADPKRMIGFEKEMVEALAKVLGREVVFVQNQWDGLIPGLQAGQYDVAVNGIEITPDRQRQILFTAPYYRTYEQLTVRRGDPIRDLKDCQGQAAGTLKFSLAQRILESQGKIDVKTYDDEVTMYEDLQHNRTRAVLLDAPIALYYAEPNPALENVGPPIGQLLYGMAVAKGREDLRRELDRALQQVEADGTLRQILDRWNLWNPRMAEALGDFHPSRTEPTEYERFLKVSQPKQGFQARLVQYIGFVPLLARGAVVTLLISVAAMVLAMALGLSLTLARLYGPWLVSRASIAYIELVRGTPLLIQLYLIYYGLPRIGIQMAPLTAAVLGLGLNYAAYEAENYRAGLLAIPPAQWEASLSLGMSRWQALRHVLLPQAFRVSLPPVTNDFISLLKDSSLVSVITLVELTKVYGQLASTYYDYLGIGLVAAAMYLLLGLPFVRLSRWAERKAAHKNVS